MHNILIKRTFFLIAFLLLLTGCVPKDTSVVTPSPSPGSDNILPLADILQGNHPLAVVQKDQIYVVDPEYPEPKTIFTLSDQEIPPTLNIENLQISPSKHYLVWYTPNKGFLKLNLTSKELDIIHPPSEWLNKNPFFTFYHQEDKVLFIDSKGTEFIIIDLATNKSTAVSIPYPFGNLFRLSPDDQQLIFISGFGQTDKYPQYMFTTIDGQNPKRFVTETLLNKRHLVDWLPDNSGVVVVANQNQVLFISSDKPNQQEIFYQLESADSEITDMAVIENQIFIFENNQVWHVIEAQSKKRLARTPIEIAEEIHRPKFIPWYNSTFLIQETLRLDPEQFDRLWSSNFMGIKKQVLDRFHETTISSNTPKL